MARPLKEIPQETYDSIFSEIATSSKSLQKICVGLDIPFRTIYSRLNTDEELLQQYTRAKDEQADYLADEMLSIADDSTNDFMLDKVGEDDYEKLNAEHINRSRLRIETRKWIASKLKPKKYGDKIEHTGSLDVVTKIEIEVVGKGDVKK